MSSILDQIIAQKQQEISALYARHDIATLRRAAPPCRRNFYQALASARAAGEPFFIAEFKRKSPSEGWINREAAVADQVIRYRLAGAHAVSVLTDGAFFGGSYDDLRAAAEALAHTSCLLLQKDFVLDPIQIYLARAAGADIILLIAAILPPGRLDFLKKTAESLGMGVLVEVHDANELEAVRGLDFPVLGINNRDLNTFRTALNRANALSRHAGSRLIIAESGIRSYRDFQAVRKADGFLIGTGLMAGQGGSGVFREHFQTDGRLLFKACGIRRPALLHDTRADFTGLNFSPLSKRRIDPDLFDNQTIPHHAVAVFYQNSEADIRQTLDRFPFRIVQLYAQEHRPEFIRSLRQKVILASAIASPADIERLEPYAAEVDFFILDGARPGSGDLIGTAIPTDFPWPFLLAGGLHGGNLERVLAYENCIGVDVASGIESEGQPSPGKIDEIARQLKNLSSILQIS
ncbi:MAG TPA: hypothetical protein PKL15_02815 [Saprospiraceae bacterium]|nr:hypothetical protein [Saprospiraceae bacterium]